MLGRLGLGLSAAQVQLLIGAADKDGDGEVDLAEFLAAVRAPPEPPELPPPPPAGRAVQVSPCSNMDCSPT